MPTKKKVEKKTASEQVYQNMRENIVTQQWKVGEKLPSEMELSSLYGVNRLTVRMALQRLNAIGLVETKVGDGTYVKNFQFIDYIHAVGDLIANPKLMDDICEFRQLIELECARLAIERATEEDFAKLNSICTEYEDIKMNTYLPVDEEKLKILTKYDTDFHEQICQMSHNTLYIYCFAMARGTLEKYIYLTLKKRIEGWTEKGVSLFVGDFRHRAILSALRNHDFEECKKLYNDMIDYNIEL